MFASEAYRRGIVVPLSASSLENIRNDEVSEHDSAEIIQLNDDDLFYRIWMTGVFKELNRICGSLVDDYEQEEVSNNLEDLQKMLQHLAKRPDVGQDIALFFGQFANLVGVAREQNMPVVFLF